ncbi:hypothetical protein N7495_009870 [Penicillium taxi]|uniref:uncharacterized protein n=1 Tax=Penicillium taxi TaxID=168475 RepID=UPI00254548AC|nr:uncharacterized protein N7495_009870 [Penicillium taxi]KAJ5885360.1 hypothetical protein N7495_009870 [Penicillium taxi]
MQFILATFALFATAFAGVPRAAEGGSVCAAGESVVCSGNGNGGLITLGNVAPGLLGKDCSGGSVYCCKDSDVQSGLVNLNVALSCTLNEVL